MKNSLMLWENFPDEVFICILKWLPAKSLMKFLCVSKSWYSLITTLYFISYHLHHNLIHNFRHPYHLLFIHRNSGFRHFIWRSGEKFPKWTKLALPWNHDTLVVGSCNGLVCLVNYESLWLWNPSIRKYMSIDRIPIDPYSVKGRVYGFGFDSSTNDYKIIAITYCSVARGPNFPTYAQFYSINSGIWSYVGFPDFSRDEYDDIRISDSCFMNGVIHWILKCSVMVDRRYDHKRVDASILTFDVHNEDFGILKLPPKLANGFNTDLCLAFADNVFAKHVCVIDELVGKGKYHVWQMQDYGVEESWMVKYSFEVGFCWTWDPYLWDREEGKVFFFTPGGGLMVFNAKSQYSSVMFVKNSSIGQVFNYTESLVFPDKRNQSQDEKMGVVNDEHRKTN